MARGLLQCGFWLLLVHLPLVTSDSQTGDYNPFIASHCFYQFESNQNNWLANLAYGLPRTISNYEALTECLKQVAETLDCKCSNPKVGRSRPPVPVIEDHNEDCPFDYPHNRFMCPVFIMSLLGGLGFVFLMLWLAKPTQYTIYT